MEGGAGVFLLKSRKRRGEHTPSSRNILEQNSLERGHVGVEESGLGHFKTPCAPHTEKDPRLAHLEFSDLKVEERFEADRFRDKGYEEKPAKEIEEELLVG